MPNLTQIFLVGQANAPASPGASIWEWGAGAVTDVGVPIAPLAQTAWIGTVSSVAELVLRTALVTVRWSAAVTLRLTLLVDRVPAVQSVGGATVTLLTYDWTLPPVAGEAAVETFAIPLLQETVGPGGTTRRNPPQGTRVQIGLSCPQGLQVGVVAIEGITLETEPIQERRKKP